jgi:hypothetical protein
MELFLLILCSIEILQFFLMYLNSRFLLGSLSVRSLVLVLVNVPKPYSTSGLKMLGIMSSRRCFLSCYSLPSLFIMFQQSSAPCLHLSFCTYDTENNLKSIKYFLIYLLICDAYYDTFHVTS